MIRIATLAGLLAFASLTAAAPAAQATPGDICMFSGREYKGSSWCWNPGDGYVDVPPALHDNVGSFRATSDGCFVNWIEVPSKKETRVVRGGDFRKVYDDRDFGAKVDAVAPKC
uniref:peptidase inhibitor family I36 protein n=1 Tax=Herbidospora sakaeratensis TaxID=564415 RepID=UPI0007C808A4|nr:peptidase inhibitor family I36 protein [Herbidospora sakaeratensis]